MLCPACTMPSKGAASEATARVADLSGAMDHPQGTGWRPREEAGCRGGLRSLECRSISPAPNDPAGRDWQRPRVNMQGLDEQ